MRTVSPLTRKHRPQSGEDGVSLTEVVVALPAVMLMVGTLVDFGLTLQRSEVVSEVAKQAARTAAIVSFEDESRTPAPYRCLPNGQQACSAAGSWMEITTRSDGTLSNTCASETNESLDCLAASEAYGTLAASGLESRDWTVRARTCDLGVATSPILTVEVEIERNADAKSCVLCLGQYLATAFMRSRSAFAVEGACDIT